MARKTFGSLEDLRRTAASTQDKGVSIGMYDKKKRRRFSLQDKTGQCKATQAKKKKARKREINFLFFFFTFGSKSEITTLIEIRRRNSIHTKNPPQKRKKNTRSGDLFFFLPDRPFETLLVKRNNRRGHKFAGGRAGGCQESSMCSVQ